MNIFKKAISELKRRFLSVHYRISKKNYQHAFLSYLKFIGVKLDGKPKFFARDVKLDLSNPSLISIGEGSVITSKVTILTHDYSIECGLVAIGKEDPVYESLINKPVTIGKNVFVGQNVFIKPGTTIGDNSIIGAGSVISGNIPEGSIVIGNPGVVIAKTREWAEKKYLEHHYVNGDKR